MAARIWDGRDRRRHGVGEKGVFSSSLGKTAKTSTNNKKAVISGHVLTSYPYSLSFSFSVWRRRGKEGRWWYSPILDRHGRNGRRRRRSDDDVYSDPVGRCLCVAWAFYSFCGAVCHSLPPIYICLLQTFPSAHMVRKCCLQHCRGEAGGRGQEKKTPFWKGRKMTTYSLLILYLCLYSYHMLLS